MLDIGLVPSLVKSSTDRLTELKEKPLSWTSFKDHTSVLSEEIALGDRHIRVIGSEKQSLFLSWVE